MLVIPRGLFTRTGPGPFMLRNLWHNERGIEGLP
ncbi:MAG: hypothetical protein ACI9K3_001488, partial [Halovenus sp.]